MNFDAYFFDLDGTLCDTIGDIYGCWRKTLESRGLDWAPFCEKFQIGPLLESVIQGIYPEKTLEWRNELIAEFRSFYENCAFPETHPYPGIINLLELLQKREKKLFVATNKRLQVSQEILKLKGLSHFFQAVFAPDFIPDRNCPKAEVLSWAVQEYSLEPSRCVMIGDTVGDIKAGKAAGMGTIGVLWGYGEQSALAKEQVMLLKTPEELLNL